MHCIKPAIVEKDEEMTVGEVAVAIVLLKKLPVRFWLESRIKELSAFLGDLSAKFAYDDDAAKSIDCTNFRTVHYAFTSSV